MCQYRDGSVQYQLRSTGIDAAPRRTLAGKLQARTVLQSRRQSDTRPAVRSSFTIELEKRSTQGAFGTTRTGMPSNHWVHRSGSKARVTTQTSTPAFFR